MAFSPFLSYCMLLMLQWLQAPPIAEDPGGAGANPHVLSPHEPGRMESRTGKGNLTLGLQVHLRTRCYLVSTPQPNTEKARTGIIIISCLFVLSSTVTRLVLASLESLQCGWRSVLRYASRRILVNLNPRSLLPVDYGQ